ncbi:MAG: porin family protein [Bacteroidota bacterium]
MNTKFKSKALFLATVLTVMASSALIAQTSSSTTSTTTTTTDAITTKRSQRTDNGTNPTARVGIKGGLNVSNLYVKDVNDNNARYGFNAGFYGQILSSEAFAIQPELLWSTKGSEATYGGIVNSKVRFNLNYIDLPVLAVFKLGPSAEIHLGPYVSYLVNANIKYSGNVGNGTDEINKNNLKSYDWGWSGGLALNFGAVQIGARYNYGMVQIADSNSARAILGNSKNSLAQLYLALNFNQD